LNWINFGYVISFADVKERSFQVEAVSSALITMIIYGVQLFFTLKRYKKDIRQAYDMKYPGFLFRHIGGGVTICFHIIFSIIIVSREIGTRIHSRKWSFGRLEWVLIFIISPLVLYTLQKIMTREGRKIFICRPTSHTTASIGSYFMSIASKLSINMEELHQEYGVSDIYRSFYRNIFLYYSLGYWNPEVCPISASNRLQQDWTIIEKAR
jgi:hypothetical protein